jgi:hypothetical protein
MSPPETLLPLSHHRHPLISTLKIANLAESRMKQGSNGSGAPEPAGWERPCFKFCGPITDGPDQTDYQMAREYVARQCLKPVADRTRALPRRRAAAGPLSMGATTYLFSGRCSAAEWRADWRRDSGICVEPDCPRTRRRWRRPPWRSRKYLRTNSPSRPGNWATPQAGHVTSWQAVSGPASPLTT